jgi:hypothetical protein
MRKIEVDMSTTRLLARRLVSTKKHFLTTYLSISAFWYFALFPGRLGFDYSKAIVMIQHDESSSWWTSLFWWYLRITSFYGRSIALSSLICLAGLACSLLYLTNSLPGRKKINQLALILVACTPLYGAFAVNVSHDVFQTCGILVFTGFQFRISKADYLRSPNDTVTVILAGLMVLTTHYGVPIIALNLLLLLIHKFFQPAVSLVALTIAVQCLSPLGIHQVPTYGLVIPIIGDLKCVAQHPMADISEAEWAFLESIAQRSEWVNQKTCSFIDYSIGDMNSLNMAKVPLDKQLVINYLAITAKNPAIVAMAHFQRASVALPPPFFFGPPNQVTRNPDVPIGQGTNTALQSYPGVLHPSIDEPTVNHKIKLFLPLETIAQASIFFVNQASWFWGWGGLWLWPIVFFVMRKYTKKGLFIRLRIISNVFLLHALLLILSAPLPRYVMSTILMGFLLLIVMIIDTYLRYSNSERELKGL